jgi:Zn-dependent protease
MWPLIKTKFRAFLVLVCAVWLITKKWGREWWRYYKTRFQLFWKRYGRLITSSSLIITYFTGIVIAFNWYEGLSKVVYQIVFSVLFAVIAIVPVWLFICSLVPKWRKHFDELTFPPKTVTP